MGRGGIRRTTPSEMPGLPSTADVNPFRSGIVGYSGCGATHYGRKAHAMNDAIHAKYLRQPRAGYSVFLPSHSRQGYVRNAHRFPVIGYAGFSPAVGAETLVAGTNEAVKFAADQYSAAGSLEASKLPEWAMSSPMWCHRPEYQEQRDGRLHVSCDFVSTFLARNAFPRVQTDITRDMTTSRP